MFRARLTSSYRAICRQRRGSDSSRSSLRSRHLSRAAAHDVRRVRALVAAQQRQILSRALLFSAFAANLRPAVLCSAFSKCACVPARIRSTRWARSGWRATLLTFALTDCSCLSARPLLQMPFEFDFARFMRLLVVYAACNKSVDRFRC